MSQDKDLTCPYCGRESGNPGGHANHIQSCSERPEEPPPEATPSGAVELEGEPDVTFSGRQMANLATAVAVAQERVPSLRQRLQTEESRPDRAFLQALVNKGVPEEELGEYRPVIQDGHIVGAVRSEGEDD